MERGTDRERRAVRERWAELERRRAAATRLLGGLSLAGGGALLLLLSLATEVCFATVGGGVVDCTPATSTRDALLFFLVGSVALGYGLVRCRRALRR